MRICVITTAHDANDVRIFHKEVKALSSISGTKLFYAAPGKLIDGSTNFISLGTRHNSRLIRFIKALVIPFKALAISKADYWHIHDPELIPFAIFLSITGKKVIWDSHEDYFEQFNMRTRHREYIPSGIDKLVGFTMNKLLKIVDAFSVGVIGATPEILKKYQNSNKQVVGNESIVTNFSNCKPTFESMKLLFIGPMSNQQSFRTVVQAVNKLNDVELVVAGKVDDVELNFAKFELGNRITHLGWVDQSNLGNLIAECSIGLMTYFDSELYKVMVSPNKFYEFTAAGLPILATPTLANIELLNLAKCGYVTKSFSAEDIASGIKYMLEDRTQWENWSVKGRDWSKENGDWDKSRENLLKVYKNILGL